MTVTILLFASLAEAAGVRRLQFPVREGDRVADLRDQLFAAHPALVKYGPNLMYAVDEEYATLETPVPAGATLALIPPVSGG